jgi:c-di-GMP-binding flagellar brake protein YcgR
MSSARAVSADFERRRHPRYSVDFPIEYWETNKLKSRPSRALNVSEGGLLMHLSEALEIGQELRLNLFTGSSPDLDPLEALVQVVWKDTHLGQEGDYPTGVKFVDISWKDRDGLKNFLDTL